MNDFKLALTGTSVFDENWKAYHSEKDYRYIINEGGTRSSKTYSICQMLILLALQDKIKINVVRATLKSVKDTFWFTDFIPMLKNMGIFDDKNCNLSSNKYTFDNGSILQCFGAVDEESVKGIEGHILYINEASAIKKGVANQLIGRTRNKVLIDYNPCILNFWVDNLPGEFKKIIYSTFLDNPFVTPHQIREFVTWKETDPVRYQVYALGKRGISESNVFKLWKECDKPPHLDEYVYGIDFGNAHATALVKVWYTPNCNDMHVEEIFYQTGLSSAEIVELLEYYEVDKNTPIIADYGGGGSFIIPDIRNADYMVSKAEKGPGSILSGISIMRGYNITISPESPNIKRENMMYRFAENRNGLNENPIKADDDAMDAIRYAIMRIHKSYV